MKTTAALICSLIACDGPPADFDVQSDVARDENPSAAHVNELARDNATFAIRLYTAVAAQHHGNLFMSPHSISTAMAMTFAGAAGDTAEQMREALELRLPQSDLHEAFNALDLALASRPATLVNASSLWGQQGTTWRTEFLDTLARHYGAGLNEEDFKADHEAARAAINAWVARRTDDAIRDLMAPGSITSDSRLVLTNAIRFQANWSRPFATSATAPRPFFVGDTPIDVESLHDPARRARFVEGSAYRAIELPYGEDPIPQLSMILIEPDTAVVDIVGAVAALEGPSAEHMVDLTLPKFRFRAALDLGETLRGLGMTAAFSDAADFSALTPDVGLKLKTVVHEGFVAIDEKGTDAAAATGVALEPVSLPPPATFAVDHPFVFIIRDRPTGAILFVGRVVDPRG